MAYQDTLKKIQNEAYSSGGKSSTYDSEVARANRVIAERKAAGQDTSAQTKYLNELKTSYNTGKVKGEAYSVGADPNNIDSNYVSAVSSGTTKAYMDNLKKSKVASGAAKTAQLIQPEYSIQPDILDQIERVKNNRIKARQAALLGLRDKTKTGLESERKTIAPQYYGLRNQESSASQLRAKKLSDMMAEKGYSEGMQGQQQIASNVALQGNLGTLKRQEQGAYDDIERRKTEADIAYESGLTQAEADADTTAAEQRLAELATLRNYGREDTQNAQQLALQQAGLTGLYNGQETLAARQQNLDNLYRSQVFDYNKSRDTVADTQWQQTMGLNLRQQSFTEAQQKIENALSQRRISQEDASQALQWAKFNADSDPNSLDNQIKKIQLSNAQSSGNYSQQQVTAYNNLLNQYKSQDPAQAYAFASSPQGRLNALNYGLNEGLYNQLLSNLQSAIPQQANPSTVETEIKDYIKDRDYPTAISIIQNSGLTDEQEFALMQKYNLTQYLK
jgi:hypothetical protein